MTLILSPLGALSRTNLAFVEEDGDVGAGDGDGGAGDGGAGDGDGDGVGPEEACF